MTHINDLGNYQKNIVDAFKENQTKKVMQRLWEHDHTLWKPDPAEISNRLGWLHSPEKMRAAVDEIKDVVDTLRTEGFTHALLLGMGGSSLAPEVFRYTFGIQPGYLDLHVLDSTDPGAVLDYEEKLKNKKTIYIVSTKSGGTVETISFMKYFYTAVCEKEGPQAAGSCFLAITDPGSGLEKMAQALNFRKIFLNDPDIGGRFSALSYFGLVPAAMIGIDVVRLLDSADKMVLESKRDDSDNSPLWLGTAIGFLGSQGRDKLTLILSPKLKYMGAWIEQLVAESSGKEGKGILPVDGEDYFSPEAYDSDRLFVSMKTKEEKNDQDFKQSLSSAGQPLISLELEDLYDLGGEYFRWEIATAVACRYLEINPFDQPNVEAAKVMARQVMSAYMENGALPEQKVAFEEEDFRVYDNDALKGSNEILPALLKNIKNGTFGSYFSIQAYLQPNDDNRELLQQLRGKIQDRYQIATTIGFGPRYLHSTGQLHKGDRGNGVFLQIMAAMPADADIPDNAGDLNSSVSFAVVKTAQAWGDREALLKEGRKVITVDLGNDIASGIQKLLRGLG
jgi:glucose-6-phosphate isomerase